MNEPILKIRRLRTRFDLPDREPVYAVDGVDLDLQPGETFGVVGESGCGKTMLALSILRLVPDPPGRVESGEVLFGGENLLRLSEKAMQDVRGDRISMIFQEPMTSLNPVLTIGDQVTEVLRLHRSLSPARAESEAVSLLSMVGIPDPGKRLAAYPHELSGGMRQRVIIAMALACEPDIILADEPTTALDVTIQDQILRLLMDLQREKGASVLLITHDLGVVARTCDRVMVMYTGQAVEQAGVRDLFHDPLHPYTKGLLASLPSLNGKGRGTRLTPVSGTVPALTDLPVGCTFHPRCPHAFEKCRKEPPPLFSVCSSGENTRLVRCWLHGGDV